MKIATFLISHSALAIITQQNADVSPPEGWFNFTVPGAATGLSRIKICESVEPALVDEWLAAAREHECAAVLLLTSDDDPYAEFYGTDSEQLYLTITVDMLDETDLWHLRLDVSRPEREYLGQWASLARGGGRSIWLAESARCRLAWIRRRPPRLGDRTRRPQMAGKPRRRRYHPDLAGPQAHARGIQDPGSRHV